jgi:hypothetical protein
MKLTATRTALIVLFGLTAPMATGGCVLLAGAAAVDYFVDDNDVCNGRNDVGLLDSDCRDGNKAQ